VNGTTSIIVSNDKIEIDRNVIFIPDNISVIRI